MIRLPWERTAHGGGEGYESKRKDHRLHTCQSTDLRLWAGQSVFPSFRQLSSWCCHGDQRAGGRGSPPGSPETGHGLLFCNSFHGFVPAAPVPVTVQKGPEACRQRTSRSLLPRGGCNQGGVRWVTHIGALYEDFWDGRQVECGKVTTGLEAILPEISADWFPGTGQKCRPDIHGEGMRRADHVVVRAVSSKCRHGKPLPGGGRTVGMDTDGCIGAGLVANGRTFGHAWPDARVGVTGEHHNGSFCLQVGGKVARHVEVEPGFGVTGIGLSACRIARLELTSVPNEPVDDLRGSPVTTIMARVNNDHLSSQGLQLTARGARVGPETGNFGCTVLRVMGMSLFPVLVALLTSKAAPISKIGATQTMAPRPRLSDEKQPWGRAGRSDVTLLSCDGLVEVMLCLRADLSSGASGSLSRGGQRPVVMITGRRAHDRKP